MNDQNRISGKNINTILRSQVKEKYNQEDYKMIQYQILQTN